MKFALIGYFYYYPCQDSVVFEIEYGWTRDALVHQIELGLYQRKGLLDEPMSP